MSDKIALDMSVLRDHAAKIDQLGQSVGEAASAAGSLDIGGGAFGVLCSFLVPPTMLATGAMESVISSSQRALARTAIQLREVAADAEQREEDISRDIRNIMGQIR